MLVCSYILPQKKLTQNQKKKAKKKEKKQKAAENGDKGTLLACLQFFLAMHRIIRDDFFFEQRLTEQRPMAMQIPARHHLVACKSNMLRML